MDGYGNAHNHACESQRRGLPEFANACHRNSDPGKDAPTRERIYVAHIVTSNDFTALILAVVVSIAKEHSP
jgi:hypothetical protein